jgi:prepilin signal peptidase PulO-like enzyme (type II secretory pathway)
MFSLLVLFSFILGAILGSFLLVVSLRHNTGKSLQGRSACFSCNATLHWYELVPVVSYLAQRGRCRSCGSRISQETLWVEFVMGLTFVAISLRGVAAGATSEVVFSNSYLIGSLFLMVLFSILAVVFLYDLRHKIIPDIFSAIFAFAGFIGSFFMTFSYGVFTYTGFQIPSLLHLLGGILVPLPFYLIWKFSNGRLIGLGDPKLMVGIGFLLGTLGGLSAVFVSFWIATLFVFSIFLIDKTLKSKLLGSSKEGIMKREVPFGPFLIVGTFISLITYLQVL